MFGIVIVAHGELAQHFIYVTEHVVGRLEQIKAVAIKPEDDSGDARERILNAIKEVDTGDGVVIITDMFGGTPSNLAISVMENRKVEVIAGVNLPMIIKLASIRDKVSMAEAVAQAQDAAKKYINVASNMLAGKYEP